MLCFTYISGNVTQSGYRKSNLQVRRSSLTQSSCSEPNMPWVVGEAPQFSTAPPDIATPQIPIPVLPQASLPSLLHLGEKLSVAP